MGSPVQVAREAAGDRAGRGIRAIGKEQVAAMYRRDRYY